MTPIFKIVLTILIVSGAIALVFDSHFAWATAILLGWLVYVPEFNWVDWITVLWSAEPDEEDDKE